MRLLNLLTLLVCLTASVEAQWSYRYFDSTQPLELDATCVAVRLAAGARIADLADASGVELDTCRSLPVAGWWIVGTTAEVRSPIGIEETLEGLRSHDAVAFPSPVFVGLKGGAVIVTADLLVRFRRGTPIGTARDILAGRDAAILAADFAGVTDLYRVRCAERSGFEVLRIANLLAARPDVAFAEPDFISEGRSERLPTDTFFNLQWGVHYPTAFGAAFADFDVDAPEMWDLSTGDPGIVIAIIDDGVQLDHPDLPRYFGGADTTDQGPGDGSPQEITDFHGTLVAGTIVGRHNNGRGVAGVAPDVTIVTLRAHRTLAVGGFVHMPSWTLGALQAAESLGARITNNSYAFGSLSAAVATKFDDMRANGVLHVAAAGNDPLAGTAFPANLASVSGVVGLSFDGGIASFSATGANMAWAGPAEAIYTTDRSGPAGAQPGDYGPTSGTSFACSLSSGLAAIAFSINPALTVDELEVIIANTCVDLGAPGFDATFANGFINGYHVAWQTALTLPDPATRIFRQDGADADDLFGAAVVGIGDLDGDGTPDFAVGAPGDDTAGTDAGLVTVFSGASGAILQTYAGTAAGERAGTSVAGLADVDGDGTPDLAIGAPFAGVGGEVRVYSGATMALLRTHDAAGPLESFGETIAFLTDLDGDLRSEYAIGAPLATVNGIPGVGRVDVLDGATGALLYSVAGDEASEASFGAAITAHTDVTGDGRAELLIGAPDSWAQTGAARLVSGLDGSTILALVGASAGERYGAAVASAVDVDADLLEDIVVGAPDRTGLAGPGAGAIDYVSTATGLTVLTRVGTTATEQFGARLARCPDLEGDGFDDVIVGSPGADWPEIDAGAVRVYSAAFPRPRYELHGGRPGERLGSSVALVGDVDGDAGIEIVVGAAGNAATTTAGWTAVLPAPQPNRRLGLPGEAGSLGLTVGGPLDLLRLNGSAGGFARTVTVGIGEPLSVEMEQPPTRTSPAGFALYGAFGIPGANLTWTAPFGAGDMIFTPCTATPGAPTTFLVTNNFGPDPCPQLTSSTQTPWLLLNSLGIPIPIVATFQGVLAETPTKVRVTNAVVLRVQ